MAHTEFEKQFSNLINAGFPYLYIPTYEEERVTNAIRNALSDNTLVRTPRRLYTWNMTDGLVSEGEQYSNTLQAPQALNFIWHNEESGVYILKDFHVYFGADRNTHPDHTVIRILRELLPELKMNRKTVVFLSPILVIPTDMEKDITVLEFPLPSMEELRLLLDDLSAGLAPENVNLNAEERSQLVRSALGLTIQEAENAYCRAIVELRGLDRRAIDIIHEEKNQVVRKTGVLEFIRSSSNISDIGGLENLKKWLLKRNGSWLERAKAYHLPAPKGVLITGVPGCGKSLTAKAMSGIWGLPLLKLDMGRIFGGIVGSSEENMRKAIHTAEAVAPSILWVDEIEKGFTGTKSGGDSGTSARVFGTFLTWMQDKTAPVFVIATSNDISALPPELLRKGRFDEIFFVDLPTLREREKIFQLHLNKRTAGSSLPHRVSADEATCRELAKATEGFSGAEIEQVVISALYEAFFANRGLEKEDLLKSIRETVPLSLTQKESIMELRKWAGNRAVLATAKEDREADGAPAEGGMPDGGFGSFARSQGGRIVDFD